MNPADEPGPLAFVADLDDPVLDERDRHHLERVLRLRHGEPLTLADGQGRWRTAVFGRALMPIGPVQVTPPPARELTVAFALIKGDRPELVVQKLTELGVDHVRPFAAARSVVRWDAGRARRQVERLRLVARAAAMQAHRPRLPTVHDVADFPTVASLPGAARADRCGAAPWPELSTVLVGPEGGWAPEEMATPLPTVRIGGHVLRSETAAIAAGALLGALRAEIVRPPG